MHWKEYLMWAISKFYANTQKKILMATLCKIKVSTIKSPKRTEIEYYFVHSLWKLILTHGNNILLSELKWDPQSLEDHR